MSKNISKKPRVVVAMSGGVDSSVAVYLLKKQGYDVVGIFLKLWQGEYDNDCDVGATRWVALQKGRATGSPLRTKKQNLCCDDMALAAARDLAAKLKIPFYVYRVDNLFKKEIVDNFILEYEKGRTPNPCVRCNRYIKFGLLWEKARQLQADFLATGHYVKKSQNSKLKDKNFSVASRQNIKLKANEAISHAYRQAGCKLIRAKDEKKDQSYFLSQIDSKVVSHLLFPLGNMTKKEVRDIAKKAKISVYNKKDSQGVCFIPDGDNKAFLNAYCKNDLMNRPGEIVDKYGNVVGEHMGLLGYTIGERIGDDLAAAKYAKNKIFNFQFSIFNDGVASQQYENKNPKKLKSYKPCLPAGRLQAKKDIPRLYVIAIDTKKNRLIVGENEDCFTDEMIVENINILDERFFDFVADKSIIYAQIRGGHEAQKCKAFLRESQISNLKSQNFGVASQQINFKFFNSVRAITPGQSVAFYDEKRVLLGGGVIKKN